MSALYRLGQRMAARNNLGLFAWVAAVFLPIALQVIAGVQEDVRLYLGEWYGPFTLYFFFVMTYGYATIFVCFYQLSAYRRQGTLDMLRIAQLTPWEVLRDVYLQLQRILLPPVLGFAIVFMAYAFLAPERLTGFGRSTIAGGMLNVVLTEMLLCAIVCLGLLRAEAMLSAVGALLVLPLNAAPIGLMFYAQRLRDRWEEKLNWAARARQDPNQHLYGEYGQRDMERWTELPWLVDWFTAAPWLVYVLGMAAVLALLLWLAKVRLARLWPPQKMPGKN